MINKEIGRELKATELVPRTVVVVQIPQGMFLSLWVLTVTEKNVAFHSATNNWTIINFVT